MVMSEPVTATMNPAPVRGQSSRTWTMKPSGAPSRLGSSENDYCVFAMHSGKPSQPFSWICFRVFFAASENSTPAPR